ncbi:hypothetical protein DPEC_G00275400 [Dallia pectoralis]|uniref:Uncharacterized protein n=1 Tax=Dallia pectoralis TaxID=75939 RepID=A0ACC2FLM5_DALPE|nr:hypothetical protein DPEC_G00275400 [Dallia pectoralis]
MLCPDLCDAGKTVPGAAVLWTLPPSRSVFQLGKMSQRVSSAGCLETTPPPCLLSGSPGFRSNTYPDPEVSFCSRIVPHLHFHLDSCVRYQAVHHLFTCRISSPISHPGSAWKIGLQVSRTWTDVVG